MRRNKPDKISEFTMRNVRNVRNVRNKRTVKISGKSTVKKIVDRVSTLILLAQFIKPIAWGVVIFLAGCEPDRGGESKGAVQRQSGLNTTVVFSQDVPRHVEFDGVVEAVNQATVAAQTAGRIIAVNYDVGDFVPKGAVIVRITDREQAAGLDAAEHRVREAAVHLADANSRYERAKSVYQQQLIAQAEYDRAEADFHAARARKKAASAELLQANENLEYTVVEAPYAGMVLEKHVQAGEAVVPGSPLMTGISLEQLRVQFDLPQMYAKTLREQHAVNITADEGLQIFTKDLRISPSANAATHTITVFATLPAMESNVFFPGALVKVSLELELTQSLLLDVRAIVRRGEVSAVYILDQDRGLQFRYVRVADHYDSQFVRVLAGLNAGDVVVTNPEQAILRYKQQPSLLRVGEHE